MRVYAFCEHFPSPFKPYLDVQFGQTLADGHDLSIFAFGTWGDVGNRMVAEHRLVARTRYLPSTLRHVPGLVAPILQGVAAQPRRVLRALRDHDGGVKQRLVMTAQAALLPAEAPDLCLVHELGSAVRLHVLRAIYPHTRIALYYHGGEVASGVVRGADDARAGFALADVVFTNTEYSRAHAIGRGCASERIHVLPVGFDLDEFPFAPVRPPWDDRPLELVTVARLSPDKGVVHAIDAMSILDSEGIRGRYTIIGDGGCRDALARRVADLGLGGCVRFLGTLPHQRVVELLTESDVLLLPSVPTPTWSESQGCVLQEAMLVGTLLVASEMGGVPESIPPEMHEFLVPPGDAAAIAAAVRRMAALTAEQRAKRIAANRRFCESGYDIRTLNPRLLREAFEPPVPGKRAA